VTVNVIGVLVHFAKKLFAKEGKITDKAQGKTRHTCHQSQTLTDQSQTLTDQSQTLTDSPVVNKRRRLIAIKSYPSIASF